MNWLVIGSGVVGLLALWLNFWRLSDRRAERLVWNDLLRQAGPAGAPFDPSVLAALPEPAQRYFRYTMTPGAPLIAVIEIEMEGQLGLGSKAEPAYRSMSAHQLLAPPLGLVWQLKAGAISGSDAVTPATSWTRFWLLQLLPVVRVSGSADHHRSAFGRVVAEGAFWVPSCLLPGDNVAWESVDEQTARAIVSFGRYSQSIELTIEADGQPSRVMIQRWSNANADKQFREQPFGGYLSDFREVGGYRLPMHVEGGNLIGTEDYFPFYRADVLQIRFPQITAQSRSELKD